ncbi:MAG TPA: ATP-binding protein [Devosiaceae bacterium]|nr:ATP-binding protein [Devosiaceae bacterium]
MSEDALSIPRATPSGGDAPQAAATAGAHRKPIWRRPEIHFGIAAQLAAWAAAIGLAAIVSITLFMYSGSAGAIVSREQAVMVSTLDAVDVRLNARLAAARGDVLFLSKTPALSGSSPAAPASSQSSEGTGAAPAAAGLTELFSAMLVSRPRYAQITWIGVDRGGRDITRVARTSGDDIRALPADETKIAVTRSVFEKTAKLPEGAVYTSDIASGQGGEPVMNVATPTYSKSGELLGIVSVGLDAAQFFDAFDQQFKQSSSQYFADQDGDYLQPPDFDKVPTLQLLPRQKLQQGLPELADLFGQGAERFSGIVRLPSESYLAAARRIYFDPQLPGRFLVVAALQSQVGLLADITSLRNKTALTATFCLLIVFLAVIWLARLIVRPLRQMTELATRVAAGDRTVDLGPLGRRGDETGELARAFEAMMREVRSRESELAAQADELQRSNHELSQFAYVASHDLQEPLRMVASYLQLLRRRYQGKLDAEADEFIGYAVDGATRMKALINNVLTYARVSNVTLAQQPLDLEQAANRVAGALAGRVVEAGGEIVIGRLPEVSADPPTIERLFTNLFDNALKYRSSAPPRIELSSRRAGGFWEISVADNGIGIQPEFREKVFEIFTRLHSREQYEGTGIGLAACRRIVERHGGRIWVDASPSGGSTFRFTLRALAAGARR